MLAKIVAISSTVALLVWMGFFFMGSLPLLALICVGMARFEFI